jgi:hypothetical protein
VQVPQVEVAYLWPIHGENSTDLAFLYFPCLTFI